MDKELNKFDEVNIMWSYSKSNKKAFEKKEDIVKFNNNETPETHLYNFKTQNSLMNSEFQYLCLM